MYVPGLQGLIKSYCWIMDSLIKECTIRSFFQNSGANFLKHLDLTKLSVNLIVVERAQ